MNGRDAAGLHTIPKTAGTDPVHRDILWRAGEVYRKYGFGKSGGVNPDGKWYRVRNAVRRKVWKGYNCLIVLETELSPGSGWRTYMETLGGDIQYPILYRDVLVEAGSDVKRRPRVEIHHADEPDDVPRYPREQAFQAAETFMTAYAMDTAEEPPDELEHHGDRPDDPHE